MTQGPGPVPSLFTTYLPNIHFICATIISSYKYNLKRFTFTSKMENEMNGLIGEVKNTCMVLVGKAEDLGAERG
jgi:hypothetical protein